MSPRFEPQGAPEGVPLVQGYSAAGWRVAGDAFAGGVLVLPHGARPWVSGPVGALVEADFAEVAAASVEVLLLGTGGGMARPPRALLDGLKARGLAVDFMDSRAAARTYNLLAGEGRAVAAALLPLA